MARIAVAYRDRLASLEDASPDAILATVALWPLERLDGEPELAWAAGLFDGEGSVFASYTKLRPEHCRLNLAIAMADLPSIERFTKAVGIGKVVELNRKTKAGRIVYRWQTQTEGTVKFVLQKLWPYLGIQKKVQAMEALASRQIYLNERVWRRG